MNDQRGAPDEVDARLRPPPVVNTQETAAPPQTTPASTHYTPLLSIDEVAAWLSVTVQTIYSWRKRGIGPAALKVGKHLRFRPADVEQFIADCVLESKYADPNDIESTDALAVV